MARYLGTAAVVFLFALACQALATSPPPAKTTRLMHVPGKTLRSVIMLGRHGNRAPDPVVRIYSSPMSPFLQCLALLST